MTQKFSILNGDVLQVARLLERSQFDAVLSDPPYGLSFMGKEWDKGVPSAEVYSEIWQVCKPGALGIHFGGTRTFHRLGVSLEDAGFEIRDCLSWLYGSGFPKSYNIGKGITALQTTGKASPQGLRESRLAEDYKPTGQKDYRAGRAFGNIESDNKQTVLTSEAQPWAGHGTALKPAWEPALLVMKPLDATFANNALVHGCGGLNIEGCRIHFDSEQDQEQFEHNHRVSERLPDSYAGSDLGMHEGGWKQRVGPASIPEGRFPANVLLDEEAAKALDSQTRVGKQAGAGSEDGASRFFYTAKVSTKERNAGCENFQSQPSQLNSGGIGRKCSVEKRLSENGENAPSVKNNHPTLKPIALTQYLARLLLPPKQYIYITDDFGNRVNTGRWKTRAILVPFSGAGSEVIGCLKAGWDVVIGIELDPHFVEISRARIIHHCPGVCAF